MKIGTLCKVTSRTSHYPSQFEHLIVIVGGTMVLQAYGGGDTKVVTGRNLNTGRQHHYFTSEIKEVKQ